MKSITVDIFELSFDGAKGVGRLPDGKIIFVPGAAPGDQLKIKITHEKKSFSQGEISEILKPSEARVQPRCPIYHQCGGCELQHINYETQIIEKQNILKRYIQKVSPHAILKDFIHSDEKWNYRNRLEAHFKNSRWGFYKRRSHDLVFTNQCLIAKDTLNLALNELDIKNGHVHVAEMAKTVDGKHQVVVQKGRQRGAEGLFSQVNEGVNQKLKSQVMNHLIDIDWDIAFDFYAGSGNFTSTLASKFPTKTVHAIELSRALVLEGQKTYADLTNIRWHQMACQDFDFPDDDPSNDLVLLDPPRVGCDPQWLQSLTAKSNIKNIIYISCNPPILFRDLKTLNTHFELISLQGFDMFPQTMHFEAVAVLRRRN